jgi:ketosteroid isomerase-like protein
VAIRDINFMKEAKIMRNRLWLVCVALVGLFLCACQNSQPSTTTTTAQSVNSNTNAASTNTASKADPKAVEEVKELLAKHDKALNDKNLDNVMATFSTDANTVVLGTGQGERYVGSDTIKQAYTEIFKDYDAGTLETSCDWKTGGSDPSNLMAWVAATCQAKDSMKGVKREYQLNVSGTVVKNEGGWRFVMLHMSNATDNGPPPPDATTKK